MLSRVLIFLFGLVVLSLGIAIVTHAGLGTGTVSSAAIVLSRQTGLSMGLFVFLTNVFGQGRQAAARLRVLRRGF